MNDDLLEKMSSFGEKMRSDFAKNTTTMVEKPFVNECKKKGIYGAGNKYLGEVYCECKECKPIKEEELNE